MTDTASSRPGKISLIVGCALFALSWLWAWNDSLIATLWPSIVAVCLVILWRQALLGLLLGGLSGCVILAGGNPVEAARILFIDLFLPIWSSSWKLGALAFTLILGGMATLIERGGGLQALLRWFLSKAKGDEAKRVQWAGFGLGLVCFFDGLANSMLVGRLMQRPARSTGVTGVKLAYIVDSTSSAVACLAVISTWIAYQLAMIQEGFAQIGQPVDAYRLFLQSIPFNFYCWMTLFLLALAIAKGFNPGPMGKAERQLTNANEDSRQETAPESSIASAAIPLLVLIGSLLVGLYLSGAKTLMPITFSGIAQAYGQADAAMVLVVCSVLASFAAFVLMPKSVSTGTRFQSFAHGAGLLFVPALVLIGAWILGGAMQSLGTAAIIADLLQDDMPLWLLPGAVFVAGAFISFSTGTSWGTMGILMPLSIPVAFTLSGGDPGALMPAVVAAVFSGAVFGDHCSPISDTSLVSAIACGVRPEDHVKTQMPYALIAAGVALFCGFLPAGFGVPGIIGMILGAAVIWTIVFLWKKAQRKRHV